MSNQKKAKNEGVDLPYARIIPGANDALARIALLKQAKLALQSNRTMSGEQEIAVLESLDAEIEILFNTTAACVRAWQNIAKKS